MRRHRRVNAQPGSLPPGAKNEHRLALDAAADATAEAARARRAFAPPSEWGVALRACDELMAEVASPTVRGVHTSVSACPRPRLELGGRAALLPMLRAASAARATTPWPACSSSVPMSACVRRSDLPSLLALGEGRKRRRARARWEAQASCHAVQQGRQRAEVDGSASTRATTPDSKHPRLRMQLQ
jgi:hypothetical protein